MERSGAHNQLGTQGEDLVAEFLVKKGWQILERNVTGRIGEVDILAKDGETVVLVEVKTTRISHEYNPIDKIDWKKQQKLGLLAQEVAAKYPDHNIRVDAVTVYWVSGGKKPVITHVESITS